MRQLNGVYTQRFDRRHGRGGPYVPAFIERMQALVEGRRPDLREVPLAQRRPLRASKARKPAEPLSPAERNDAIAADYAAGRCSMRELADRHGVHPSTVSRAVVRQEAGAGAPRVRRDRRQDGHTPPL